MFLQPLSLEELLKKNKLKQEEDAKVCDSSSSMVSNLFCRKAMSFQCTDDLQLQDVALQLRIWVVPSSIPSTQILSSLQTQRAQQT